MKRLSFILLSVLLISTLVLLMLGLASCDKEECDEHTFDDCADTECNECGETRDSMHTWVDADCDTPKTCSVCNKTEGDALGHSWSEVTCLTPKTCSVCQTTEGDALGHTPEADDGNCMTEIKCGVCDEVTTAAKSAHVAHADDGDCSTPITCTECATETTAAKAHDFTGEWLSDADGHWHECANEGCSVTDTKSGHTPNQDAATVTEAKICTVCDYVIEPKIPHTCDYSVKKKDETHHWLECTCGEIDESSVAPHTAEDDGDCTTADVCSCGYTVRAARDHVASSDDGNCTTSVNCANCGKTAVSAYDTHVDSDHDYICDNDGCQISVDAPKDENEGVDLPTDIN